MSEESAEALEARGRELRAAGRVEEARDAFYSAFQLDNNQFDALMACGECCVALSDFDAALQIYAIAQRRRPEDVAAVFNLGASLEMQGDPVSAVRYYETANQLRPRTHTKLLAAT